MIKTIMLDLDGVICDFRRGIHEAFGKPYDYPTLTKKWKFWDGWSDVTFEMVNAVCVSKFWAELKWTFDGHDILRAVIDKFHSNQIYLLTTPMPNLESASGKMMWVNDNLPVYLKRTIITQAPKHLLARPDTLLCDDKDQNINEFRKAGGKAILINRPWNAGYKRANHTIEDFRNELEKMFSL